MSGDQENIRRHASWFQNQNQNQDQVPSVDLNDRTTNMRYLWEGLQHGQTNLQQAIPDPPHNLGQNVVTGLGPVLEPVLGPRFAPFDEVDNQYMPSVRTSHVASYDAGEDEKNQL